MKYSFSTFTIQKKLGIPRSNIQQYIDRGFLHPSISQASGKGDKNLFSLSDLYGLILFLKLSKHGLSQKESSKVVKGINWESESWGNRYFLVIYRSENNEIVHSYTGLYPSTNTLYWSGRFPSIFTVINLKEIKDFVKSAIGME